MTTGGHPSNHSGLPDSFVITLINIKRPEKQDSIQPANFKNVIWIALIGCVLLILAENTCVRHREMTEAKQEK